MLPILLAATFAAAPIAPPQLKLAAPGFSVAGVDAAKADLFLEYFGQRLGAFGVRVTTRGEIATVLGFERQKELLGCSAESTSCFAELGGALGVDGVISGSVGKVGASFVVTLKILRARDGQPLGGYAGRFEKEEAVLDWLGVTAQQFASEQGLVAKGPVAVAVTTPVSDAPTGGARSKAWLPLALGGGLAVVGVLLSNEGRQTGERLRDGRLTVPDGELSRTIDDAKSKEQLGVALLGLGVVGVAAGAVMFALGGGPTPAVTVAPLPGGGAVVVEGRWP